MTRGQLKNLIYVYLKAKSLLPLATIALILSAEVSRSSPGENALDFLNLPVGADAAALGQGCYAGIIGPEAIFGNPSLLGKTAFFASHQELLLDTRLEAFALAANLGGGFTLGLGALLFSPGQITGYSADNLRTGSIDAGDRAIKLALSKQGRISWGVSASYYHQRLDSQMGNGLGAGAGISAETQMGRFSLTADNLGPAFTVASLSAPLPARLSISGWIPLFKASVGLSLDLSYGYLIGMTGGAGLEYSLFDGFQLRAGSNNSNPVAFGFGLSHNNVAIDYSYIPPGDFGDRHILSLVLTK